MITMPNGDPVKPVRTITGTAPHPSISIEDAIGDLLRFDWYVSRYWYIHALRMEIGNDLVKREEMIEAGKMYLHSCVIIKTHVVVMKVVVWDIIVSQRRRIREIREQRRVLICNIIRRRLRRGKLIGKSFLFSKVRWKHCSFVVDSVLAIPMKPGADFRSMSVYLSLFWSPSHTATADTSRLESGYV